MWVRPNYLETMKPAESRDQGLRTDSRKARTSCDNEQVLPLGGEVLPIHDPGKEVVLVEKRFHEKASATEGTQKMLRLLQ
jgi:hypothetical protein